MAGGDEGAGADDDPLDGAVSGGRDPADLLGDQGAGAAHLPHHRATLHGVEVDGVAVDARRGRLQARDAQRDDGHHQDRGYGIQSLAQPLLPCEIGSGDIHGEYLVIVPRASDSYRLPIECHEIYRMSIGGANRPSTPASAPRERPGAPAPNSQADGPTRHRRRDEQPSQARRSPTGSTRRLVGECRHRPDAAGAYSRWRVV